ncbi:MAG: hypothetical protein GC162_15565 [Planctomycetes bacterium]|nr:hypothetical protein [Planctomycetota bacterium]
MPDLHAPDFESSDEARMELAELAERYVQGDIDAAQFHRLNHLLSSNAALRAYFVALCTDAQIMRHAMTQRDHESFLGERLAQIASQRRSIPIRREPVRGAKRFPLHVVLPAAAIVIACSIALYVMSHRSGKPTVNRPLIEHPVATLIDTTGSALVNDIVADPGFEYAAGTYSIGSGSAQFLLTSRVTVNLRGATSIVMHDPMHATLQRGWASFDCPHEARGFTVDLPDGSHITDLGTAFNVHIDDHGRCDLRVTDGHVHWIGAEPESEPLIVAAGHAIRLIDGQPLEIASTTRQATISLSTTAPEVDSDDVANLGEVTGQDKWWADGKSASGRAKGQTFATGDHDVLLRSLTVRTMKASEPQKTFAIRIGIVIDQQFTSVATATAIQNSTWGPGDYVTFIFDAPIRLDANTLYAFDIGMTHSTTEWTTGIPYLAFTPDRLGGGERYHSGADGFGIGDSTIDRMPGDMVFHLDLSIAPALQEPGH